MRHAAQQSYICFFSACLLNWFRVKPSPSLVPRLFLTASIALAVSQTLTSLRPEVEKVVDVEIVEAVAKEASLGAGVISDSDVESESALLSALESCLSLASELLSGCSSSFSSSLPSCFKVSKEGKPSVMPSRCDSSPACKMTLPPCCTTQLW